MRRVRPDLCFADCSRTVLARFRRGSAGSSTFSHSPPNIAAGDRPRCSPLHQINNSERDVMTQAANLGFPRIGAKRELKQATEAYWKGSIDAPALRAAAAELRARHWKLQRDMGIAVIPSNDFSFYDQMLDMTAAVGAIPPRFLADTQERPTHPNGSGRGAMEAAAGGAGDTELTAISRWRADRRTRRPWR